VLLLTYDKEGIMGIKYAILGILSHKSFTGYDLKKIIQESDFMHWSGNNNQIYKALLSLYEEGFVTNEVQHKENSPSKKLYTISERGREELKKWSLSNPEVPEFKKKFLIQLAWSNQLSNEELKEQLSKYENEIRVRILMSEEKKRREGFWPNRNSREIKLWDLIHYNIISSYENELAWIEKVKKEIFK
jgi:PadR family transcriptional regulator, regulatory protein AphA